MAISKIVLNYRFGWLDLPRHIRDYQSYVVWNGLNIAVLTTVDDWCNDRIWMAMNDNENKNIVDSIRTIMVEIEPV